MTRHIAFISDPLDTETPATQTTLSLMLAAQQNDYRVFWMGSNDLHIKDSTPVGYMAAIELSQDDKTSFSMGESFVAPLERLDLIWWRKAPPYSLDDLFLLDTLQMVNPNTTVLNHPKSLRSLNEQLYPLHFPELIPSTLVTKKTKAIQGFLSEVGGKAVLRSLQPSQAHQSFFLRMGDPNMTTLLRTLTHNETECVLVQKLVTEPGLDGDKRLFLLDGQFMDIALQIPAIGELRGSFERGAKPAATQPSDKDLKLAQVVGAKLKEDGIFFATVDVSDGLIVDVNLSCPSGLDQLQSISDENYAQFIFQRIQRFFIS